jgi:hypothetical protein
MTLILACSAGITGLAGIILTSSTSDCWDESAGNAPVTAGMNQLGMLQVPASQFKSVQTAYPHFQKWRHTHIQSNDGAKPAPTAICLHHLKSQVQITVS